MRRLTAICCFALAAITVLATPINSQQRSFALRGGGTGVFLDGEADHTMILRPAPDGRLRRECIQGDRHVAAALLQSGDRVVAPETELDERVDYERVARAMVSATMRFDPDIPTGVDDAGRVLLYMPNPVEPGSSRSHFDPSANPDLLMEPFSSPDLPFNKVDVTDEALRDMGWRAGKFRAKFQFTDDDGTGFKDPVLGPARRKALRFMLRVWGRLLGSASKLTVAARFDDLSCSPAGATLAHVTPLFVAAEFRGGIPGVWYPGPMAESIVRADLSEADDPDIAITFNAAIDEGCMGPGTGWYYGLDNNHPPQRVAFLPVALHEMGHGLGFLNLMDLNTGAFFRGLPDILATMTLDNRRNQTWDELPGNKARLKSLVRDGEVAFTGDKTRRDAKPLLRGAHVIQIIAPDNLAGTHIVGRAFFGPALDQAGLAGDLALADDGTATPTLACGPLVNGAEIAGKIAVVHRGDCLFVEKVKSAQDAGASGVVVVNNVEKRPIDMGGSDGSITIPAVMVTMQLGKQIERRLV
ncbi:MAG TPA: PA domain-containing protein [Acidobacteriota bacterium]|nr:PA domain-containing protein [Acidobacteriota bacterium]